MTPTVALVTGASRGLGRALALECARRGAHVAALARTVGALEELDDEIAALDGAATLVPLDVVDDAGIERLGAALHERWGRLDLWLHCATHAPELAPAPHVDAKTLDRTLAVNVRATQRLIRALDPLLRAGPSGVAALFDDAREGSAFFGAYAASKAAARALWRAWGAESRAAGLRIRVETPPEMPTALRGRFFPGQDAARLTSCAEAAGPLLDAVLDGADLALQRPA